MIGQIAGPDNRQNSAQIADKQIGRHYGCAVIRGGHAVNHAESPKQAQTVPYAHKQDAGKKQHAPVHLHAGAQQGIADNQ